MKAVYCTQYGSPEVLEIREIDKPTPKENELLIQVVSASITTADTMIRQGTPFYGRLFIGLTKPKHPIMGTGFAGVVVEKGNRVSQFEIGDEVFGETILNFSSNAQFLVVNEEGVVTKKPKNVSFAGAASVCDGLLTSYNFLSKIATVKPGDKVLINGASGSLGTAAVQLAKYFGAHVTAVCSHSNIQLVKSLGADEVIDYTQQDFTKATHNYTIIYDTIGKSSYSDCKKILYPKGIYLSPVLSMNLLCDMFRTSIVNKKRAKFSATGILKETELKEMLKTITELLQSEVLKMVMDKEYTLEEIKDAHSYIESGRKKGNVTLSLSNKL